MPLFHYSRALLTSRVVVAAPARANAVIRYKSTTAPSSSDYAVTPQETAPGGERLMTKPSPRTPDDSVDAPVDAATSAYSTVPLVPENRGPDEPLQAAAISGAPLELQSRTVRIYKPAKPATQSGTWNTRQWKLDWDPLPKGHRWENQLMGWQSSGDFMQGTSLSFKSKEDAVEFAEKQGYSWYLQEPNTREFRSKSYAANFVHSPKKLKIIRTK